MSARVLLLIALLAPMMMIVVGIASRRHDPAGAQVGPRQESDAPTPDPELAGHQGTPST